MYEDIGTIPKIMVGTSRRGRDSWWGSRAALASFMDPAAPPTLPLRPPTARTPPSPSPPRCPMPSPLRLVLLALLLTPLTLAGCDAIEDAVGLNDIDVPLGSTGSVEVAADSTTRSSGD